jgi:AcrR family transcriptional regulator
VDIKVMHKNTPQAKSKSPSGRVRGGRRPDSERSKAGILNAAYKLFVKRGFAATTITDIAASAGVAKGLVLFHFKTKEDVFHEVVRRVIPTLLADLEAINSTDERSAAELLRDALRQIYRNIVKRPQARAILRLLIAEGRRFPILSAYYHAEVASRGNAALTKIVEIGVERGEFSIEMSENVSHVLLGPLIGSLFWQMLFENIEPLDIDQLYELHISMALNGLIRQPPEAHKASSIS